LISYSLEDSSAYLYCREAQFDDEGVRATLVTPQGEHHLRSTLLGRFNLSNVLAAVGALLGLDYALDEILKVCRSSKARPVACSAWAAGSRWWWSITPTPRMRWKKS
jgi:UDP-N-acetylmuramyl tripeptide synthase